MLTRTQMKALDAIRALRDRNGICPSFEELRIELGLAGKSAVHAVICRLEERNFIRRLPGRARAIELVEDQPEAIPA